MSHPLPAVAESASHIDWTIVGSAGGIFVATVVTGLWGLISGKDRAAKKLEGHIKPEGSDIQIAGAVLQDNQSLRENTQSNKDLRDQMMMSIHCTERHTKSSEELVNVLEDVLAELKALRRTL